MSDDDIRAFTPSAAAPGPAAAVPSHGAPRPRRLWTWVLAGVALLFVTTVLAASLVMLGLLDGAREGLTFIVDGQPWQLGRSDDGDIDGGTVFGVAVAAVVVATVVPLVVLAALLSVALTAGLALLAGLLALVLGLACGLAAVALALSPLWGLVLLCWLLMRRPKPAAPAAARAV